MKKFSYLTLLILCTALLAACGGKDSQSKPAFSDSSNPTENVSETAENSADPWSESFEFEDVGNDPNNLWQTLGAGIAFDDEHIYYTSNGNLCRIDYNGADYAVVAKCSGSNLNVYKGYAYYTDEDAGSVNIKRINLENGQNETVFTRSRRQYDASDIHTMFITGDYIFINATQEVGGKSSYNCAISLKDFEPYFIFTSNEDRLAMFTTDNNGNVYALIKGDTSTDNTRALFRVTLKDIEEYGGMASMEPVTDIKTWGRYNTLMFSRSGIKNAYSDYYENYPFATVKDAVTSWTNDGKTIEFDGNSPVGTVLSGKNPRFMLDGNLVVLVVPNLFTDRSIWGEDTELATAPVYVFENMDLANGKKMVSLDRDTVLDYKLGTAKNKIYIVKQGESGQSDTLYTVDSKGNVTTAEIHK